MNIKLDRSIRRKVLISRKHLFNNNLDLGDKLLILQVFSRIKPAASFDYVKDGDRKSLISHTLKEMGLHSHVIEHRDINKIIFGRKNNVERLANIHDVVFTEAKMTEEYGTLLGYPSCCIKSGLFSDNNQKNILFNRYSGLPLIFHSPCSANCKESIALAMKALKAYYLFDTRVYVIVISELKKPILKFHGNLFVKFDNHKIKGNCLSYGSISVTFPSPIDEQVNKKHLKHYLKFFDKMKKGNKLHFSKNCLKVFCNKKLLIERKFNNNQKYELLNIK